MKNYPLCLLLALILLPLHSSAMAENPKLNSMKQTNTQDSVLRHVVLFKFKPGTPAGEIDKVQESFVALKSKIPEIATLEWGINNSPEGLDKGFTHCFFLTFRSEKDRETYLPHPDHRAFGDLLGPILEDVLVVDYWTP
jgi:hypothetical protein